MEKETILKVSKFSLEIKQTVKGIWHLGSIRVNANTLEDFDSLMDSALNRVKIRITNLNSNINSENKQKLTKEPKQKKEIKLESTDFPLYYKLKQHRFELSRKENVPNFFILHNRVLTHIAHEKPSTKEELLKIEGIGPKKLEKSVESILKIVNEFITSKIELSK